MCFPYQMHVACDLSFKTEKVGCFICEANLFGQLTQASAFIAINVKKWKLIFLFQMKPIIKLATVTMQRYAR